jgi:putative oxidoreductase
MSTLGTSTSLVGAPFAGSTRLVHTLLATGDRGTPAIARIALGLVILPHGLQKTLGLFGGYGFDGTMAFFTDTMGLPWWVALAVVAIESVGALTLLVGAASRLAAAGVAAVMLGAALTSHVEHGFFMNWFGNQAGEGFEFHILALALASIVMVAGGGKGSIDRRLSRASVDR